MSVSPKRPPGPSLNAMRAFEAAARHVSFVDAAEELSVSAGAISQHIKTLEHWSDTQLFMRNAQGVELTPEGRELLLTFTVAFDKLAEATHALRNLKQHADFHIAALPSVAQLWLPKRLAKIRTLFPDINFSVTALETPPSLSRELFDLSIFFNAPNDSPNQYCISKDEIQPMCTASLLPNIETNGFSKLPLLHDLTWQQDWTYWTQSAKFAMDQTQAGPQYSLYSLAVEEAKSGAGLLMGHLCLLRETIQSGELVAAHEHIATTGRNLTVEIPDASLRRPETGPIVELLIDLD